MDKKIIVAQKAYRWNVILAKTASGLQCFALLLLINISFAQRDLVFDTDSINQDSIVIDSAGLYDIFESDTTPLVYYYESHTGKSDTFDRYEMQKDEHHYDGLRRGFYPYANLGFRGSPVQSIIYQASQGVGLQTGMDAFQHYNLTADGIRFYKIKNAYTHLEFSQGNSQVDTYARAVFAGNFKPGIKMSFELKRTRGIGDYINQISLNTLVALGTEFTSKNKRYQNYIKFTSNIYGNRDFGGIRDINLLKGDIEYRSEIAVWLTSAKTRYQDQLVQMSNYYKLGVFRPFHRIEYQKRYYKIYDEEPDLDYYQNLVDHNQSLRSYLSVSSLENMVGIRIEGDSTNNQLEASIHFRSNNILQEPHESEKDEFFLRGNLYGTAFKNYSLRAKGVFHFGQFAGDHNFEGEITGKLGKRFELRAGAQSILRSPPLVYNRYLVSHQEVWQHSFDKIYHFVLHGSASYKDQLIIGVRQYLLGNYVYFNQDGFPIQDKEAKVVAQLYADILLKWRFLHTRNRIYLQRLPEEVSLPALYSEHDLYFEKDLFKSLLGLRTGFSVRNIVSYQLPGYIPIIGQFTNNGDQDWSPTWMLDYFIHFRVESFAATFRFENLNYLIQNYSGIIDPGNANASMQYFPYPMRDFYFRFAVSWSFRN